MYAEVANAGTGAAVQAARAKLDTSVAICVLKRL